MIKNVLCVEIRVVTNIPNNEEFTFHFGLKDAEYITTEKKFLGVVHSTAKTLVKYTATEYNTSENYKAAMDCYNEIIKTLEEV
jgi:hypothetical protein